MPLWRHCCYDAWQPPGNRSMSSNATSSARWAAVRMEARAMLGIGLPIIIHNLALVGMGLTDAIMAGMLGAKTLAGVAVGSSAWAPVFLFSLGLIMAQSPTTAHLFGAGKHRDIGRYARQMAWISLLMGVGGLFLLRNLHPFLVA